MCPRRTVWIWRLTCTLPLSFCCFARYVEWDLNYVKQAGIRFIQMLQVILGRHVDFRNDKARLRSLGRVKQKRRAWHSRSRRNDSSAADHGSGRVRRPIQRTSSWSWPWNSSGDPSTKGSAADEQATAAVKDGPSLTSTKSDTASSRSSGRSNAAGGESRTPATATTGSEVPFYNEDSVQEVFSTTKFSAGPNVHFRQLAPLPTNPVRDTHTVFAGLFGEPL